MAAVSEAAAPAVDDDDAATVADDDRAAERHAIDAFAAVLSSCDGFALEGLDDDGLKRMKRGKMLHGVIALKFPATKREDLRTMAREWVRGMLETTYPLEKRASRSRFAGPGDSAVARHAVGETVGALLVGAMEGEADGEGVGDSVGVAVGAGEAKQWV